MPLLRLRLRPGRTAPRRQVLRHRVLVARDGQARSPLILTLTTTLTLNPTLSLTLSLTLTLTPTLARRDARDGHNGLYSLSLLQAGG